MVVGEVFPYPEIVVAARDVPYPEIMVAARDVPYPEIVVAARDVPYNRPKEVEAVRLYNTLTRETESFEPQHDHTVGLYVCGPTVYDHIHIGNVRPILVFDTLRRYFERFKGWRVVHVQNVTDVDDKLIQRSIETGRSVDAIAKTYTDAFFDLLERLHVLPPTHSPLATEHIQEMIALVTDLIAKGCAYEQDGDVYFRVEAFGDYGKLSGRRLDEQEAGARIETSEKKENPFDFTLWKAAKPGEPTWPTPWGSGRPGWHTECVVMSQKYLGDHLDIHAGGNDLVFPHHENEIAQAEAATGKPFFRFWLHNGMLAFQQDKMSKSVGNVAQAHEVLDAFDPETIRYFFLSRHYRKPMDYSEDGLRAARTALTRIQTLVRDVEAELRDVTEDPGEGSQLFVNSLATYRERYIDAMDDDLNTVDAIGVLQEIVGAANRFKADALSEDRPGLREAVELIRELAYPLGLLPAVEAATRSIDADLIDLLIELRALLRAKKEFELSDRIRDRLDELGIVLKDGASGTIWATG
jgi:cysteinyl-tRNA synthetase